MYKINDIDLSTFGITPLQANGQTLATTGVFDFPARKGMTEHNWGTETEAFVSAADLLFDGRNISFKGLMKAANRADLLTNLDNLVTLCTSGMVNFETRVGTFSVVLSGEIEVVELCETVIDITLKFRQPVILFPVGAGVPSGGEGYRLSGYNFKTDFGITVNQESGRLSTPARIEIETTAFYANSAYRQPRDISISCTMLSTSLADLTNKMGRLHGLLSLPGFMTLTFPDETTASVYQKSGFNVSGISEHSCQFTLNLRQI